jgi:hypothetical protein
VPVETIDGLLEHAAAPDFIKLDLQGTEPDARRGAQRCPESAELCLVELSCLEAYLGRTTPKDLMQFTYERDYCLYDVVDCHYRPYDGPLIGGDFIFVQNDGGLRSYKG